jgi:DNA processing protein
VSVATVADSEHAYWVLLSAATGVGPIRFQRLLQVCGGAEAAWHASDLELHAAGLERRGIESLRRLRQNTSPTATLDRLARLGITTLTLLDDTYPPALREIADPPPVLFVRGTLAAQDANAVAMVGTRQATSYGRAVAAKLAIELAQAGVTVVSGLAKGVDTAAHRAALEAGGRTLAVLGNGLDQVYPAENRALARHLVERNQGALISEFAPGVPPDAVNFPRRNRIIAGMSRVVVIVEADLRSGALITADFALEQGRDVMSVPGSILSRLSAGTNDLLKQGATPVTGVEDILNAVNQLGVHDTRSIEPPLARDVPCLDRLALAPQEKAVWDALDGDPHHVDGLARLLGCGAGDVSASLAILELRGLARQVGTMVYTRA